jgi:serine/threonine protein kinase
MENFVLLEDIAQTKFSTIKKCKNTKTKDIVALKSITTKKAEEAPGKEILNEILVLSTLTSPYVHSYITYS